MKTSVERFAHKVIMKEGEIKTIEPIEDVTELNRRRDQYNDIMANVNPLMMSGSGRNRHMVTATATIPLSCCFIDKRYQGMRAHKRINRLIAHWDVRKLSPIVVVPHPEEFRFAIADGQGRYTVAPLKGMDRLTATILMDAPDDPNDRLRFEAEYFIGQDTEVENVKDYEKHQARVIIGDEPALILEKLMKKYGVRYVSTKGRRGESILGSYSDTYFIAKIHGEKCLNFIFSIIENAGWNNEPGGYSSYMMKAMKESWIAHPGDRDAIHKFLSSELRKVKPSLFSAIAKTKYPNRDSRACCSLYLEDLICEHLPVEKKIYIDGSRNCKIIK